MITLEKRQAQREANRKCYAKRRASMTPEQKDAYRKSKREYAAKRRASMTSEQWAARRESQLKFATRRRGELAPVIGQYKEFGCVLCGYNHHPSALHFHHKDPSEKQFEISRAVSHGRHKDDLVAELEKCVVLCANCHTEVHAGVTELPREKQ